jgi:hypothetical protein
MSNKMAGISTDGERHENNCLHTDGTPFPDPSGFSVNYGLPFDHCGAQALGHAGSIGARDSPPAVHVIAPPLPEAAFLTNSSEQQPGKRSNRKAKRKQSLGNIAFIGEIEAAEECFDPAVQVTFAGRPDQRKLESAFSKWLRQFLRKAKKELESAHRQNNKISPVEIVNALGPVKARELIHDPELEKRRRSLKRRTKEAEVVKKATQFLEEWIPDFPEMLSAYPSFRIFRNVAEKLQSDPDTRGRIRTTQSRYGAIAAFRLAEVLDRLNLAQKDRDQIIRRLIGHAFPECRFVDDYNVWGLDRGVAKKIKDGKKLQKYPDVQFKDLLLCRQPKQDRWTDWHFHRKCSRWPNDHYISARFNTKDPRVCRECAELGGGDDHRP